MLEGFVGGLIIAWFLSWFGVDHMIVNSARELFNANISKSTYYVIFGLIGLLGGAIKK